MNQRIESEGNQVDPMNVFRLSLIPGVSQMSESTNMNRDSVKLVADVFREKEDEEEDEVSEEDSNADA